MGLFSPKKTNLKSKEKSTRTTTADPYGKGTPDWLKAAYEEDVSDRDAFLDTSAGIAADLAADPRDIAGMDPMEVAALKTGHTGFDAAQGLADKGTGALAGLSSLQGSAIDPATGFVTSSAALGDEAHGRIGDVDASMGKAQGFIDASLGNSGQAAGFMGDTTQSDQAAGFANDTTASDAAMKAAGYDMDALRGKYESGYTDDVVNTTLAGMGREAARQQLGRESQAAGIGGTSNSRTAVANAVSQQLTGMNMAEQEAKLRDAAFNNAVSGAQGEAKLELDRSKTYDTLANTGLSRGSLLDDLANTGITRAKGFDTLANTDLSRAGAQGDITDDQLATGDYIRGLSADDLKRSTAMLDIGELGLDIGKTQASGYGDAAAAAASRGLNEATMEANYGAISRGLTQDEIDAEHNAGRDAYSWLGGQYSGAGVEKGPLGGTTTEKTKSKGTNQQAGASPFQQIAGAATAAAGAYKMSDERVKEDITPVHDALAELREIGAFDYRYKPGYGEPTDPTRGLMAQHMTHIPGAVVRDGARPLRVDPYPVLATVVRAVQQLDRKLNPPAPQSYAGLMDSP